MKLEIGTTRTARIPLASGSGTPDDMELLYRDPSGNEATIAMALSGSYYVAASAIVFDEAGSWELNYLAYTDDDATNPKDHKRLVIDVLAPASSYPFTRA